MGGLLVHTSFHTKSASALLSSIDIESNLDSLQTNARLYRPALTRRRLYIVIFVPRQSTPESKQHSRSRPIADAPSSINTDRAHELWYFALHRSISSTNNGQGTPSIHLVFERYHGALDAYGPSELPVHFAQIVPIASKHLAHGRT